MVKGILTGHRLAMRTLEDGQLEASQSEINRTIDQITVVFAQRELDEAKISKMIVGKTVEGGTSKEIAKAIATGDIYKE